MREQPTTTVFCNQPDTTVPARGLILEYQRDRSNRNVALGLPRFVRQLTHLPARLLDLLEIAAYVYAADRNTKRGQKDAVEYHAWARHFLFHIRVRDIEFWGEPRVRSCLSQALEFMTGDLSFEFEFYPGHSTPPASLFDKDEFVLPPAPSAPAVSLFSGGLDSLAGVLELLENSSQSVLLVSHQSQPGTKRTQQALAEALRSAYGDRVGHYRFECHLKGTRASEESQRSRSFLYASIGLAAAYAHKANELYVFENGVTSINLARRADLLNARASRTTHPRTLALLQNLFTQIAGRDFSIQTPFIYKTKTQVVADLRRSPHAYLISSAVSCTRTFKISGSANQCGECSQCLDRRIAAHAAGASDFDHPGLYAVDIISQGFQSGEARTTAVDYLRQAIDLTSNTLDRFYGAHLDALADVVDYLPGNETGMESVERIWDLFRRHGVSVIEGLQRIRTAYDDPKVVVPSDSLLRVVADREYLTPPVDRLVKSIMNVLESAIPKMFRLYPPENEPDFNQKVAAVLKTHHDGLRSEHPDVSFACARVVPDHEIKQGGLLIESKYVRQGTPPSKVTDGIASDLTKYRKDAHILFVVYDPNRAIPDDEQFRVDFESKGRCTVQIIR